MGSALLCLCAFVTARLPAVLFRGPTLLRAGQFPALSISPSLPLRGAVAVSLSLPEVGLQPEALNKVQRSGP